MTVGNSLEMLGFCLICWCLLLLVPSRLPVDPHLGMLAFDLMCDNMFGRFLSMDLDLGMLGLICFPFASGVCFLSLSFVVLTC